MSAEGHGHDLEHDHEHEHHHKDTFITKYIFSIDHKMIAKQYLISGIVMGVIGVGLSMLFRMQLAWPEESRYGLRDIKYDIVLVVLPFKCSYDCFFIC
jgi:cytochrome c oxidase subunit 1